MFEVRWVKSGALVDARKHEKLEQALRDACQLSGFYAARFGVTHAEVWGSHDALLLQMPASAPTE